MAYKKKIKKIMNGYHAEIQTRARPSHVQCRRKEKKRNIKKKQV